MDSDVFDRWTRGLDERITRRGVRGVIAGALSALGAIAAVGARKKKKKKKKKHPPLTCEGNLTACDDVCVNLQTDEGHCSACGAACESNERCQNGQCETDCGFQYITCGGECRLFGACCDGKAGFDCSSDFHAGEEGNWVCCTHAGFGCHDLDSNKFNCAACGHQCAAIEVCCNGNCQLPPCPPG